jgi:branched-chain amino acid transport system ATP-binding protein
MTGAVPGPVPGLAIEGVDLFYGDAQALSGVSLEVPRGAIVAIVGANGAGKSSLIHAIAGLETARAGRIAWAGREIQSLPPHEICDLGIGQVAEGRQVFGSLTVLENLEVGAMLPRARRGFRRRLDEVYGYFPRLRERARQLAGTLSGGEQQMVAIGRCLMGAPELIMFDEPSLGLAPLVVRDVFRTIRALGERGITILLVEQNVAVSLKISQRAYVLETGRIVLSGTGDEVLASERVRQAYLGL